MDRWDRWAQQVVASLIATEQLELGRRAVRTEVEARLATALANGLDDGADLAQHLIEDPAVEDLLAEDEALTDLLSDTAPEDEDEGEEDDDSDDEDDDDFEDDLVDSAPVTSVAAPRVFDPVGVGFGADDAEVARQKSEGPLQADGHAASERAAGPLAVTPTFETLLRTCEALAWRAHGRSDRAAFFLPSRQPTLSLAMVRKTEQRLGVRLPDDFWAAAAFGIEALCAQGIAAEPSYFGERWTPFDAEEIGDELFEVAGDADGEIPAELLAFVNRTEVPDEEGGEDGGGYLCVRRPPPGAGAPSTSVNDEIEWVCGNARRRLGFAAFLCERLGEDHARVALESGAGPRVLRRARLV